MSIARKDRGKKQNIFLIEMIKGQNEQTFMVMGTTGNVYTVVIKEEPECTCPDFETRGNRCKHIYFILIRVMHVTPANEDKSSYSATSLKKMFDSMPTVLNNIVAGDAKDKYIKLQQSDGKMVEKKPSDDACPICLDDLENGEELDYCKYSCGKQIHTLCFSMWQKKNSGDCVFCRHSWTAAPQVDGYLNLLKGKK